MKKLLSKLIPAVVSIMLLSTGTAFASQDAQAKALYEEMNAKSSTMSDGNMYCHVNMLMGDGTTTINMNMDMNMLYKNMLQPEQMEYLNQAVVSTDGLQMQMITWYKDGYIYTDANGTKSKMKVDMTSAMNTALSLSSSMGASTDLLSSLSLTTNGDQRVLSYTMDESKMNSYVNQIVSQMGMGDILSLTGAQMKIYNVGGTYTLTPDNNFSDATITMAMDITINGKTVTAYINGVISVLNQGQPVEFTLPSPDGYTEVAA